MISLLDQEATNRGISKCTLTVDPFNGKAIHLYMQSGYQITGYKRAYFGNDYPNTDRFWMEKVIKAQTHFYEETRQVRVDDVSALEAAILQGFVGTDLIRSQDQNPKRNLILFKKLKK